ncbi:FixH family protein [Pontibacillus litoralis]|uniref:YtkA-like domain-containing protein n=1 Tax=Pontibacillus litoralis JSM 072002 TaxID=1385512 RepID=A0A0A5G682_9BACI|nr:FixH family protein [Pontibacillus litoralis]KGX87524.1 hypothetical protein N784_14860 [Pontibacillus litoralis JSM 072002]
MKGKLFLFAILSMLILALTACGNEESNESEESLEPIEVEVSTDPSKEELMPNEDFTIGATVTHKDEPVNDADEVRFEFWQEGQADDEHEMIDGTLLEDGMYTIDRNVEEAGTYYVIAHVTAREMHNMPKETLQIGNIANDKVADASHEGHSESEQDIMAHIMVDDEVEVNKEISLVGHLQQDEAPFTDAEVQFEVWQKGEEKHAFIDATEGKDGEYTAAHSFEESGEYIVKFHYKKDDLHDYAEKTITAQ